MDYFKWITLIQTFAILFDWITLLSCLGILHEEFRNYNYFKTVKYNYNYASVNSNQLQL